MKRIPLALIALLLGSLLAACSQSAESVDNTAQTPDQATTTPSRPTPQAEAQDDEAPTAIPATDFARTISAIGEIQANQTAELFFAATGTVAEVYTDEGDTVAQGDLLAILDTRPFDQRIRQAEAGVADALARQSALTEQPQAYDVNAARARVAEAEAALAQLLTGPKEQDIQTAQSVLEQTRVNLQIQRDTLASAKVNAELQIEQSANALRDAQDTYSQIYWDNRELEDDLRNEELPQENKNQEEAALRAVETAEQQLEQAQLAFEEAQKAEVTGIQNAEQQVIQAEEELEKLLLPPDADDVAAAESAIAQAQAELDRLFPDPTASELNQAAAAVSSAQSQLADAQLEREYAELQAPFDGIVSIVAIDPGDPSGTSGQPVIELVDNSSLYVEVDISDIDIVSISMGQPAEVYVDALPGEGFAGEVSYISPSATINGNVRTFEVHVVVDNDERLQDGMSARVEFSVDEQSADDA